jgi:F0F1-type ATP synthase assembly protein I
VDLREKRALNNGFGEALSRAFEFAVTPVIFGFIGHLLDMRLGTSPALLLVLAGFAVVGMFVKLWYAYDADMKVHESARLWARKEAQDQ